MNMLSSQCDGLREAANMLDEIGISIGHDTTASAFIAHDISERMCEAADTIESLRQKIEDLEGMLGELPPEGKCAMLLVKQVDGEYIWGCELYDFASYCLVDSEADTYTGMMLNDPFGRADFADKLTMAKELRRMAASLDAQGDVLGIMPDDGTRWHELFGTPERAARTLARMCAMGDGSCAGCPMFKANLEHCNSDYAHLKSIVEWLRGDA